MLSGMRIVAQTGDRFASFGPYVPAIDNHGRVAFQAELTGGGTGVFIDGEPAYLSDSGLGTVVSHPDLNVAGDLCFYAERDGETRAVRLRGGDVWQSEPGVGPLGPTMNEAGDVAYRGEFKGRPSVLSSSTGLVAREGFGEFLGLPLMSESGEVIFRADEGIWRGTNCIVSGFDEVGRFPCLDADGRLGFVARRASQWEIHVGEEVLPSPEGWQLRGALINSRGLVVFYATPPDRELGIYRNASEDPLLQMGGPFEGSSIVDFALNPVSVNEAGQVAIRVKVADGREFVVQE